MRGYNELGQLESEDGEHIVEKGMWYAECRDKKLIDRVDGLEKLGRSYLLVSHR